MSNSKTASAEVAARSSVWNSIRVCRIFRTRGYRGGAENEDHDACCGVSPLSHGRQQSYYPRKCRSATALRRRRRCRRRLCGCLCICALMWFTDASLCYSYRSSSARNRDQERNLFLLRSFTAAGKAFQREWLRLTADACDRAAGARYRLTRGGQGLQDSFLARASSQRD